MNLVVDANIPLALEAFSQFGKVRQIPGRDMKRSDLAEADALIVRSVTKVDRELLHGMPVRFVGTATIGTDHLDIDYLEEAGITWNSAAGCNASSVVEWVIAAMVEFCVARGEEWEGKTLGIVGHGNIGSRLAVRARGLGFRILVNDPPLERDNEDLAFVPLEKVLAESDFLTLHVPMIKSGRDRTVHLIGSAELAKLKDNALLLNASRGVVVDNAAALEAARSGRVHFVLDVFENEPRPARELIERCFLATPHIAGYSYEGKVNGTRIIADALARFARLPQEWHPKLPEPPDAKIELTQQDQGAAFLEAVRRSYPIREDDRRLREGLPLDEEAWGRHFDELRKSYHQRREFCNYQVSNVRDPRLAKWLKLTGFAVSETS